MAILSADYSNINYEEMAKGIGLKPKHMPMLIASFMDESGAILEALGTAVKANDYAAIALSAHSIKGSAGNLRFNEVYEMAKEMEMAGKDSRTDFDYVAYFDAIKNILSTLSA